MKREMKIEDIRNGLISYRSILKKKMEDKNKFESNENKNRSLIPMVCFCFDHPKMFN